MKENDEILQIIESIEFAVDQQAFRSGLKPEPEHASPRALSASRDESGVALSVPSTLNAPPATRRSYPDASPPTTQWTPRVRGSAAEVLQTFRWGER